MKIIQNLKAGWTKQRLLYAGVLVLVYSLLLVVHINIKPYSDDLWYAERAAGGGFFEVLWDFYMVWSGRLTSNAICFLLFKNCFWLWQILNPLFFICLAWLMARIATPKPTLKLFGAATLLLLVLGPGVLDYSVFWATGSIYYLWPLCGALFLLMPFFDMALRDKAELPMFPLRIVLAVLVCMCNEQITPCVLAFMAVVIVHRLIKTKKIPVKHLVLFCVTLLPTVVLFAAPGSQERYLQESYLYYLEHYIGFYEVPLIDKIANGVTWMYNSMFSLLYLVLLGLFGASWYSNYARQRKKLKWPLFALGGLALAASLPTQTEFLFTFTQFDALFEMDFFAIFEGIIPYLFWTVFLVGLLYMLARQNFYYALGLLAALATVAVLFFSPTIYVSGPRTLMLAGVFVIIMLLAQMKNNPRPAILWGIACFAVLHGAQLVGRLGIFFEGGGYP